MVEFPQESIDIIIDGSYLVLWSRSILNFLNFFYDFVGDLFPPFLTLQQIIDFSNMP